MRFRLVTVAILLAIASRGDGRPTDPDPFDGSQETTTLAPTTTMLPDTTEGGSPISRYTMMTMSRRRRSPPTTDNQSRVISISSPRFISDRSMIPSLSFENRKIKNYLPLGALSSPQSDRQSVGRSTRLRSPFLPLFTPIPIPAMSRNVEFQNQDPNSTFRNVRHTTKSSPRPIPVSIPMIRKVDEGRSFSSRGDRKTDSRTLVRIVPQKLKPGYMRRNFTGSKFKHSIANLHLKNWPNEAVQSVQDLLNYEKYTSFHDDDKGSVEVDKPVTIRTTTVRPTTTRQPSYKRPGTTKPPVSWTRIPTTEVTTNPPTTKFDFETTMPIDNLLDDLAKNKRLPQTSSEVMQNTVVHIFNAGSKKPNVTVVEPVGIVKKANRTKTGSTRPPQNVHIMFMVDKDDMTSAEKTATKQRPPTEILGGDSDCPTIMINSITQINNTIQSKEGCTDLNIVINSHVLNTNIVKPSPSSQTTTPGGGNDALKNPYTTSSGNSPYPSNNYNTYPSNSYPTNSYPNTNNYPNNNYGSNGPKDPAGEPQLDSTADGSVQTLELFQNTEINIGNNRPVLDFPEDPGIPGGDDPSGSDVNGPPFTNSEDENDPTEPVPAFGIPPDSGSDATGQALPPALPGDVGAPNANEGLGVPVIPSLPSLPNIPRPPNLPGSGINTGGSAGGTASGQGTITGTDEEDEIDELVEAISPVGLLSSIASVFTSFSVLNPFNYGIFGLAVAPFVAFAAGILGVAAFLFPWAFPGYPLIARALGSKLAAKDHVKIHTFSPHMRDFVLSSIHKYEHMNEWKARRRKKKRKR